jgi:aminoglycoside phosphotransferase (APT) family kinase protein
MAEGKVYSQRLGVINDAQFEAVAARWQLGRFVHAEPTTSGLFGQNVFLTTSDGEFVLRGAPHWVKGKDEPEWRREDRWQFTKEAFFAQQLRERTSAPVPWPMQHDQTPDIFGWPYLVMPRMPGICFEDRSILKALSAEDRRSVAEALGTILAEMQTLRWPFAGDFGVSSIELEPYANGDTSRSIDETMSIVAMADANGVMTDEDKAWIGEAMNLARVVEDQDRPNVYVHGDYKLNNLSVERYADGWCVAGLFDLHESHFGDGAFDLVRQASSYLDTDPPLAKVFVDAYRARSPADPSIAQRMPLHIVNDRMKIWQFFTQHGARADWTEGKTFRGWAQRYMDRILELL